MRKAFAIFLFALLLPLSANAATCTGATYYDSLSDTCVACPTGYDYNTESGKTAIGQCQTYCAAGTYIASGDYTRVEYLESTGTQYIDTGIFLSPSIIVNIKYDGGTTQNGFIFGITNGADGRWAMDGDGTFYSDNSSVKISVGSDIIEATCDFGTGLTIDGTTRYFTITPERTAPAEAYLFKANWSTAAPNGKIYYFTVLESNNLVRNLIPVRRNSDSVLGMLDLVSGEFLTNAGSGTFTAGADVGPIAGTCTAVGNGYYSPATTVNYGDTAPRTLCEAGYACSGGVRTACTGATYSDTAGASSCTNCPTATALASRVTGYWYFTSNGIHDTVNGCRATITEQDPTADYTMSCAIVNGDYGVTASYISCMAGQVTSCAAGRYAPWANPNANVFQKDSIAAIEGTVCVDAGAGYYSPAGDLNRYACTNTKPANSSYSGSATTNACPWACNSGYTEYAGACHAPCADGQTFHVDGLEYPLFADDTNVPSPALHFMFSSGNICHVFFAPNGNNAIRALKVLYNDIVYRAIDPR